MKYFWSSIRTFSYWKYALFTGDSANKFFSVLGAVWLIIEILERFKFIDTIELGQNSFFIIMGLAVVIVIASKRPVSKICYKIPGKDLSIEVIIGDLLEIPGQRIISTNTTFDTDISSGLISRESLQGQFTEKYFKSNVPKLDQEIVQALAGESFNLLQTSKGKAQSYPIGTVAKLTLCNEYFYLLAMARLDQQHGNTICSPDDIKEALKHLWSFMLNRGEKDDIIIPILGTGRGRIKTNRKKVIEWIAQSFIEASSSRIFSHKLIIAIHPLDAQNFDINLFEIRDYLAHTLEH